MFRTLKKWLPNILQAIGVTMFLSGGYLFFVAIASGAVTPEPNTGRIYSVNNHGEIRYVSWADSTRIDCLLIGGWLVAASGIWMAGRRVGRW